MKKFVILFVLLLFVGLLSGAAGLIGLYYWASSDLPSFRKITDYRPPLVTTVYTRDNKILGYFYSEKRFLVTLSEMPDFLPKAFLAAEDATFYQHEGVDITAIGRAMIKNLQRGGIKQGGSTITQQIIKRLLLSSEKSYKRKVKEAILAYRLEKYLTKDEILTIYLNQIYLGSRAYGVEAAARTYFGVHVTDLTIAQAALLAGLPQAPTRYSPFRDFESAKNRQRYVLGRMLVQGWITKEQHDAAVAEPLVFKSMPDPSWEVAPFYLEEVRRELIDRFGEDQIYNGGLHVHTAVDIKHQEAAERALRDGLVASEKRRGYKPALEKLEKEKFEDFYAHSNVPESLLVPGRWVKALVQEVTGQGAVVRFGDKYGLIPADEMSFAKGKVEVGDLVWASILAVPDKAGPARAVADPAAAPAAASAAAAAKGGRKAKAAEASAPSAPSKPGRPMWKLAMQLEPRIEGGLVSMDPRTGEVLACVGGFSFEKSQFNRATQSFRQPGSSFKPVVYSVAMDNGMTPATVVMDGPFSYRDPWSGQVWTPGNYEGDYGGPMTIRSALAKSKNLVTVRVAQQVGMKKIVERAQELGLRGEFVPYLPVSLGAVAVNLLDMVHAYSAFARDGSTITPRFILDVKSPWGEEIFVNKPEIKQVLTPQTAYVMDCLLKEVVRAGTATAVKVLGRPLAGKTGTTNDFQDAWFMGFSPYLLTGCYIGFDQPKSMGKGETGGRAALPIWLSYRKAVEDDYPVEDFSRPPGIVMGTVDGVAMAFKEGTERGSMAIMDQEQEKAFFTDPNAPLGKGEDLLKQMF
ncbi:penicillin-binding protein, 1A family [Solidesulfovibrio carbinoliphilus subsp. oakridgensis]|uniref:Penicillin-binding protein, 1A family n=1 Tax=Solidesulfovibrio carbinoliphilus subsp. oakridgensis TaxID=694327 RepID=G7QBA8_9BACT|nr:PBP1A family penicillin-binding protein [Solidesulfovibrio carbinoliphilus]EHJ49331.1 penicillin-binding protein, 1A family [Solidesulfovibrio carbinoliphilus subsp. oakridgensis]